MAYQTNEFFRTDRGSIFGGVCAGLSESLQIDVLLIRIIAIVLALALGLFGGLIIYLLCCMMLPKR